MRDEHRLRRPLVAALVCSLMAGAGILLTGIGQRLDDQLLSLGFRLRPAPPAHPSLSVVVLRGQANAGDPPPVREALAELLEYLVTARIQPAAIGVDVLLSEREPLADWPPPAFSLGERIVTASESLGTVVHALALVSDGREYHNLSPMLGALTPHLLPDVAQFEAGTARVHWQLAHPQLAPTLYGGAAAIGNLALSHSDGTSLLALPMLSRAILAAPALTTSTDTEFDHLLDTALVPSLALAEAALLRCPQESPPETAQGSTDRNRLARCIAPADGGLWLAGRFVPLDAQGRLRIQYRRHFQLVPVNSGSSLPARGLEVLAFRDAAHQGPALVLPTGEPVTPESLRGRALLVIDARERQTLSTPLGPAFPPATAHAQALAALLTDDWLRPVPLPVQVCLAFGGLLVALMMRARGWGMPLPGWLHARAPRAKGVSRLERALTSLEAPVKLLGLVLTELLCTPETLVILAWGLASSVLLLLTSYWLPPMLAITVLLAGGIGWRIASGQEMQLALEEAQRQQARLLELREQGAAATQRLDDLLLKAQEQQMLTQTDLKPLQNLLDLAYQQLKNTVPHHAARAEGNTLAEQLQHARQQLQQTLLEESRLEKQQSQTVSRVSVLLERRQAWRSGVVTAFRALEPALGHLLTLQTVPTLPMATLPDPFPVADEDLERAARLGVITRDPGLLKQVKMLDEKLSKARRVSVLILGETGTGKEMLARALHQCRFGTLEKMLEVNCTFLQGDLGLAKLTGWKKGAFNGAIHDQPGIFEEAEGGTVLLDEVAELPEAGQKALLRILQERNVVRWGEHKSRPFNVCVVAATKEDLPTWATEGKFRDDLYYRLADVILTLPPLRQRLHDIDLLAPHLLALEAAACDKQLQLSDAAIGLLKQQAWPGNVRQLRSVMQRIAIFVDGPTILEVHIQEHLNALNRAPQQALTPISVPIAALPEKPQQWLTQFRSVDFDLVAYVQAANVKRPRADAHLRTLLILALPLAGWEIRQTTAWLVGATSGTAWTRVLERFRTFQSTLKGYSEALNVKGEEGLYDDLRGDYGTYRSAVIKAVHAFQRGQVLERGETEE